MGYGAFYEIICFSALLITLLLLTRLWRKDQGKANELLAVLLVGLFFGVGWEPQGTELIWSYPGYRLYAFMDIPVAILVSWSWWMVACRLISNRAAKFMKKTPLNGAWSTSTAAFYISGILVALVVEPLSVALGGWNYLVIGKHAVLNFPLLGVDFNMAVIVGWGLLTTINLKLAKKAQSLAARLEARIGSGPLSSLGLASAPLGLFSGVLSWQLVGLLGTFFEGMAPRFSFTRYYVFILEGVTSAQLIGLLIVMSMAAYYLRGKRAW